MIINKDEQNVMQQNVMQYNVSKTIEVLNWFLSSYDEVQNGVLEHNAKIINEQKEKREKFASQVLESHLMEKYNDEIREKYINDINKKHKMLLSRLTAFQFRKRAEIIQNWKEEVNEISKLHFVKFNETKKSFDRDNGQYEDFSKYIKRVANIDWVSYEVEIKELVTKKADISSIVYMLKCVDGETVDARYVTFDFNIKIKTKKINIYSV